MEEGDRNPAITQVVVHHQIQAVGQHSPGSLGQPCLVDKTAVLYVSLELKLYPHPVFFSRDWKLVRTMLGSRELCLFQKAISDSSSASSQPPPLFLVDGLFSIVVA